MATPLDFGFVVPLAAEGVTQLEACLGFLRAAHPEAPVTVVCDGAHDEKYAACCKRHNVAYTKGAYLKRIECGGAWWRRTLEAGLLLQTPWIIKLDPDTRCWRPFKDLPRYAVAGTLEGVGTDLENVQGGCQAISSAAARKIVDSGLCEDEILRSHAFFAVDAAQFREWNARAYFCTDKTLLWMLRNLGIEHGAWDECGCHNQFPPDNHDRHYAVTHPHKLEVSPRCADDNLQVIVTCKSRLHHLQETLPRWVGEPGVDVIVVDYDCPDSTVRWVTGNYPQVTVVHATGLPKFHLSAARNLGARAAKPGWWCFFDADWLCEPGWAWAIRKAIKHRHYLLIQPIEWSQFGSVVVHSYDYQQAGGYDELFQAWGSEDSDLYLRLRQTGTRPGSFPSYPFSSLRHSAEERTQHYGVKDIFTSCGFYDTYIACKRDFMFANRRLPTRGECKSMLQQVATGQVEGVTVIPSYRALYPPDEPTPMSVVIHKPRERKEQADVGRPEHSRTGGDKGESSPLGGEHPITHQMQSSLPAASSPLGGDHPGRGGGCSGEHGGTSDAGAGHIRNTCLPGGRGCGVVNSDDSNGGSQMPNLRMDFGRRRPMTWDLLCNLQKECGHRQQYLYPQALSPQPHAVEFTAEQWKDLTDEVASVEHAENRRVNIGILASDTVLGMRILSRNATAMCMHILVV